MVNWCLLGGKGLGKMRQGPAGSIMIYFKLSKYIEGDVYGGLLKCRIPKTVGSILELQEDV